MTSTADAANSYPIGPITKGAILGVVFGLTTGILYAASSEHVVVLQGAVVGFAGGLVGGTAWGAMSRFLERR